MNCIGGIQGLNGLGPWRLSLNGRRPETPPHIMNTPCHLDPSDLCQSHPRPSAQALIVHLHGFEPIWVSVAPVSSLWGGRTIRPQGSGAHLKISKSKISNSENLIIEPSQLAERRPHGRINH